MKLKLFTHNTQLLNDSLSIMNQRKLVIVRFTPQMLYIILVNHESISQEPQIWTKIKMGSVFGDIEIQSINNNNILIELNADLLLQALKHYEKANSDGLHIRLQKKDIRGNESEHVTSRNASLALFYSHMNVNSNTINHTFRIPVKILKSSHSSLLVTEPELTHVDLLLSLPNAFGSTYKRLDKFRASNHGFVTIKASRRLGGFLGFVLQEDNKFKVTISWNEKLDIRKPSGDVSLQTMSTNNNDDDINDNDETEDIEITVKLKDWKMSSKIIANCKTMILLLNQQACMLHCLLEDTDDVEVIFYMNAIKIRNE